MRWIVKDKSTNFKSSDLLKNVKLPKTKTLTTWW